MIAASVAVCVGDGRRHGRPKPNATQHFWQAASHTAAAGSRDRGASCAPAAGWPGPGPGWAAAHGSVAVGRGQAAEGEVVSKVGRQHASCEVCRLSMQAVHAQQWASGCRLQWYSTNQQAITAAGHTHLRHGGLRRGSRQCAAAGHHQLNLVADDDGVVHQQAALQGGGGRQGGAGGVGQVGPGAGRGSQGAH